MLLRQYKILIVDDSLEDRNIYRRYLTKDLDVKYEIKEAETGEEGLEIAISWQPDLIMLDYLLPDIDGLEFIEDFKDGGSSFPPIIMLTGQGNELIAVEAMKSGVKDYIIKGQLSQKSLLDSIHNALEQERLQALLDKSWKQQQLIAETALRIRQSLDLETILTTAVDEVRLLIDCDRVVIYRFERDFSGDIVAEAIKEGWKISLGANIVDTCFQTKGSIRYRRGESLAINDVYKSSLSQCHLKLLEEFQVKASIIVPILVASSANMQSSLWGLLIAHQCDDARQWEQDEVEILEKLAVQLSIAIQQAELIGNLKTELRIRTSLEKELARRVQILESSEDYIGLATVGGQVVWNNPRMKEVIGIHPGSDLSSLTVGDYHPAWALDIVLSKGIPTAMEKGSWIGETALLAHDGTEIAVSQLIIAHKSSKGEIEFLSTVMRDLTLRKAAEKSLQERAKQLEWVNQELIKTTSLLKKRNDELDRFAYVTSHDLKAPLRAIANLATWLSEDLADEIPIENQKQLQLMQSRVQRMDNLINGLLEYSRVGRKSTPVKKINVRHLVEEIVDSIAPPPGIQVIVADDMPTIETEIVPLQQVFANLIGNAVKYHPCQVGRVIISVKELDNFYQFAVADDGSGIDPQYHERIFTIFQTLQARDTFESTGIGLSIVKKIVETQGGKVWLDSECGRGSTFYFTWRK